MSAAEDRIRQLAAKRAAAQDPGHEPQTARAPRVRATRVRSTVDLPPARHAALKAWCADSAIQLGEVRITTQQTINALVHLLLTDELMSRRVRAAIADELAE